MACSVEYAPMALSLQWRSGVSGCQTGFGSRSGATNFEASMSCARLRSSTALKLSHIILALMSDMKISLLPSLHYLGSARAKLPTARARYVFRGGKFGNSSCYTL